MKIALKKSQFHRLVMVYRSYKVYYIFNGNGGNWKNCSFQLTIMGQLLKTEYSKFKIFVADYMCSMFVNCLEENMMDFSFMTSTTIKQKGR